MRSSREVIAAIFWGAALYPALAAVGLVGSVAIVRILSTDAFGVLAWTLAVVQVVLVASDLGTTLLLQRGDSPIQLRRLLIARVLTAAMLGAIIPLAGFLPPTSARLTALIPAICMLQSISTLMQARLAGAMQAVALRLLGVANSIALPVAVVAVASADVGAEVVLVALLISSIAEAVLGSWVVLHRSSSVVDLPRPDLSTSARVAGFYYVDKLGKAVGGGSGGLLLGGLSRTGPGLAILGLGVDLGNRLEGLSFGALGGLLFPAASRLSRERGDSAHALVFRESTRYLLGTFAAFMVFCAAILPTALPAIYGARYTDAVIVTQVLLIGQAVTGSLGPPAANFSLIAGKFTPAIVSRLTSAFLVVAAFPLFERGPLAIAFVIAAATMLPAVGLHFFWMSRIRPDRHARAVMSIAVPVALAGLAAWVAESLLGGWIGMLAAFATFTCAYVLGLRITGAVTAADLDLVRRLPSPAAKLAEVVILSAGARR